MSILIHACCAPCLIMPYQQFIQNGIKPIVYFDNPNIQPFSEYELRLNSLKNFVQKEKLELIVTFENTDYEKHSQEHFSNYKTFKFPNRCSTCYYQRLERTAKLAAKLGLAFTTSLLYSKYQKHNVIKKMSLSLAKKYGTNFVYEDYRKFWYDGIKQSKELGMYRQKYCGCKLEC